MDIDIYQQCPCHSGKKIKFCCGKDIVAELSQIAAKCESNKSLSALEQIDRVIAKHGEKDCLLILKAHVLFTIGEIEQSAAANQRFIELNPNNPMGRQHEALTSLAQGNVADAVEKLQNAMDLVDGEIPLAMANTFRMLGSVLLKTGHLIAARAHLQFSMMIRGEADQETQQILQESFRLPQAPLILKTDFRIDQTDKDAEWSDKYEIVIGALNRGQFRLALKMLQRLDEHWPNQPIIVRGIAVAHSMLANEDEMSAAWRAFSQLDGIPRWQAIESECLSQMFLLEDPTGTLDLVMREFEISDFDTCNQSFLTSKYFEQSEVPAEDLFSDGPPPRSAYFVLNKEKGDEVEGLKPGDIPEVTGELLIYGKQTDRSARVVVLATKVEPQYGETIQRLKEMLGDCIGNEIEEEVISSTSVAAHTLSWNWKMPRGVEVEQHKALLAERRNEVLHNDWVNLKFSCLDNLTPLQAKDKSELAIPLAAAVTNLEQSTSMQSATGQEDLSELRQLLGIPDAEVLDASQMTEEYISPMRACQIDPKTLSDEQMTRLYFDSVAIGNMTVLRKLLPEALNRDSLAATIPRDFTYTMLAQLTADNEQALEYMQLARAEAKTSGGNIGMLLVQEFELRLSRGITEKLPELLQTLQKQYLTDANVEYQLARVLGKFGLISPDGRTVSLPSATPSEEADSGSKLWTPDSGDEIVPAASDGGGSKIWVPGAD